MAANLSHAVMAQRHQDSDDLDFFPTPPWGTRALSQYVLDLSGTRVWEPSCGRGHMARPLAEVAGEVVASDIVDRGFGRRFDFLALEGLGLEPAPFGDVDWIVMNPPFALLHRFAVTALRVARRGVAILGRLQLQEGNERYNSLYLPWDRHYTVAPFVERLPMEEGCCAPDTSTATAYAWLVIDKLGPRPSPLTFIPPCRKRLERAGDYDPPDFIATVRAEKARRAAETGILAVPQGKEISGYPSGGGVLFGEVASCP